MNAHQSKVRQHCTIEALESRLFMSATLPSGFVETQIPGPFYEPTGMEFAPDGRIFVTTKGRVPAGQSLSVGTIRIIKNGVALATPFLSLQVDTASERGLVRMAFDPNFATNRYVYVYYTKPVPANPNVTTNGATDRLSRFTVSANDPDVADPNSELVLLDNIPSATGLHHGGVMKFAADGKLFLSVGDSGMSTWAQDIDRYNGKVLRLDVANFPNLAPASNPFYDAADGITPKDYVWALGLRNPNTGALKPDGTGLYINDVGAGSWEEIDDVTAGKNYGWPNVEGTGNNPAYVNPIYTYAHNGSGAAIVGGTFYTATQFPSQYQGQYFFVDYVQGWMRTINPSTYQVSDFGTNFPLVTDLDVGPDGSLYYLSLSTASVWKVTYVGSGNRAPVANATATPSNGLAPLPVNFSGTGSSDPDGDALYYAWNFGDGQSATGSNVSHTYSANGKYNAVLTVSDRPDGSGLSSTFTLTVSVGNRAPIPTITSHADGTLYVGGQQFTVSGFGYDADYASTHSGANLPAKTLTWSVNFQHNTHFHPFVEPVSGVPSITFTIPQDGETDPNQWYRVYLTATDSGGLSNTTYIDLRPTLTNLTLATTPVNGMTLSLDGSPVTSPNPFTAVVGMHRTLAAAASQVINGVTYDFSSWSDGGAATHVITVPNATTTYTARYVGVGNGLNASYFNNRDLTGSPTFTRVDSTINFNWGDGSPGPSIKTNNFSVRWTGQIKALYTEAYTFYAQVDDLVRLWVNGQLIIDKWSVSGLKEYSGSINLVAGQFYDIKMEYADKTGAAAAQLRWSSTSTPKAIVPQGQLYATGLAAPLDVIMDTTNELKRNRPRWTL